MKVNVCRLKSQTEKLDQVSDVITLIVFIVNIITSFFITLLPYFITLFFITIIIVMTFRIINTSVSFIMSTFAAGEAAHD